jgi:hypothetical protein
MTLLTDEAEGLLLAGCDGQTDNLFASRHHLAHAALAQVEDVFDEELLVWLHQADFGAFLHQVFQLVD